MTTRGWAAALVALLATAGAAEGGISYLGGFRPVAAEDGARSLWVNPAAIGARGLPAAAADVVWDEEDSLRPGDARRLSVAVSMPGAAYGVQWDLADEVGVPAWTVAAGNRFPIAGRLSLGFDLEWRGGEDSALDGGVGALLPWQDWRLGAAITNLLEPTTQGVQALRTWQLGASWRPRTLQGRVTYDAVLPAESDARHWFGIAFDETRPARLSFAMSSRGDWNATVDFLFGRHVLGIGARDLDGGSRREFAAWEWEGQESHARRGPRIGFRH